MVEDEEEVDISPTNTIVVKNIYKLRHMLDSAGPVNLGFVPTMGALHEGHLSLIRQARQDCDSVVVSIFVNPLQFGPAEDFSAYPREVDEDAARAVKAGADLIFAPDTGEMYPEPQSTKIAVGELGNALCGRFRPGHFEGVATVVAKLFNLVCPQRAYFGAKDWQQLIVIKKMVKDLNIPVEIMAMPTVRDPDGLAISSRNRYLTAEQRAQALVLPRAIRSAAEMIRGGVKNSKSAATAAKELIAAEDDVKLEYFSICRPDDLEEVGEIDGSVLVAAAIYVGETRLIDNMVVET